MPPTGSPPGAAAALAEMTLRAQVEGARAAFDALGPGYSVLFVAFRPNRPGEPPGAHMHTAGNFAQELPAAFIATCLRDLAIRLEQGHFQTHGKGGGS